MSLPLVLIKEHGFYAIPMLEQHGLRAVFTTRIFNMRFDDASGRRRNRERQRAYRKLGMRSASLITPSQVHSATVALVGSRHAGCGSHHRLNAIQETDALITNIPGLKLGILTADCLPIFIYDRQQRAIALIHAGWRGLFQNIIAQTILKMRREFSTQAHDLLVAFGSCLRSCCYEVGKEFLEHFPETTRIKQTKCFFDIIATAKDQLYQQGVAPGNIHDSHLCTGCLNQEFFSFRREGEAAGRSMSILGIL